MDGQAVPHGAGDPPNRQPNWQRRLSGSFVEITKASREADYPKWMRALARANAAIDFLAPDDPEMQQAKEDLAALKAFLWGLHRIVMAEKHTHQQIRKGGGQ